MKRQLVLLLLSLSVFALPSTSPAASQKTSKTESQDASLAANRGKSNERGTDAAPLVVKIVPPEKTEIASPIKPESKSIAPVGEAGPTTGDWAAIASACATFVIMLYTISLARSTTKLWKEATKASEIAEQSAKAAETAANAAMASLDRPWLVVEGLECNRSRWIAGEAALIAKFRVANYGNAPAFVLAVNAAFFLNAADFKKAFPDKTLPDTVKDVPSPDTLRSFVNKYARTVRVWDGPHAVGVRDAVFDAGQGISSKDKSQEFFSHEIAKLDLVSGSIALLSVFPAFLIGHILYSAPNGETGLINFCYEMRHDGIFRERYGAPYNERKRGLQHFRLKIFKEQSMNDQQQPKFLMSDTAIDVSGFNQSIASILEDMVIGQP